MITKKQAGALIGILKQIEDNSNDKATLRDKFAMAALQGIVSTGKYAETGWSCTMKGIAESAYDLADAMMKAR